MDDLNAFERLVANEMVRRAGPDPVVDDVAIFTAIAANHSRTRSLPSMLSAAKFVVAAVIVALFGGFLLAVILTTPRVEDLPPAAVSPSPMTTEEQLSGMATEEVEPGVLRVLDDGAGHDLASMHLGGVWAGADGSMWVLAQQIVDEQTWGEYRLLSQGRPGDTPIDVGNSYWFDMAIDTDGTIWAKTGSADRVGGTLATNDGTTASWRTREYEADQAEVRAVEAGPDGSLWVTRAVSNAEGSWVARHDGSGWTTLPPSDDPELRGDYLGEMSDMDVGPDGTVWVANGSWRMDPGPGPHGVLRFDGGWVLESPMSEPTDLHAGPLAVGSDGTAWVYLHSRQEDVAEGQRAHLARWSDGEWTTFGSSEGVMELPHRDAGLARLEVDDDGSLWIAFDHGGTPYMGFAQRAAGLQNPTADEGPCLGVLSFDGASWRQYLRGRCVNHVAVAPDGSIWASAATHPDRTDLDTDDIQGLYVITPEAVAATQSGEPDVEDAGSPASLPAYDSLVELQADASLRFTDTDGDPLSAISIVTGETLLIRVDNTTASSTRSSSVPRSS